MPRSGALQEPLLSIGPPGALGVTQVAPFLDPFVAIEAN